MKHDLLHRQDVTHSKLAAAQLGQVRHRRQWARVMNLAGQVQADHRSQLERRPVAAGMAVNKSVEVRKGNGHDVSAGAEVVANAVAPLAHLLAADGIDQKLAAGYQ